MNYSKYLPLGGNVNIKKLYSTITSRKKKTQEIKLILTVAENCNRRKTKESTSLPWRVRNLSSYENIPPQSQNWVLKYSKTQRQMRFSGLREMIDYNREGARGSLQDGSLLFLAQKGEFKATPLFNMPWERQVLGAHVYMCACTCVCVFVCLCMCVCVCVCI